MKILKKAIFRISRILIGRKGIYGEIRGRGNKFTKGVFVEEIASIGMHNYFGPYSMINHAIIGNYCSIGPAVKIGQGNHSKDYITTCQKISKDLINHSMMTKPAIIGNDVWCGANSVIMQGVIVGDGAIIGANAVVTHDVPSFGIAIGVPAKVNRYRFNEKIINNIMKSNWYGFDIEEAKSIILQLERHELY